MKIHGSPFYLYVRIAELESSLEVKKKSRMNTATPTVEMKSHADEALRALKQENKSQAKDREAYEGRVVGLMKDVKNLSNKLLRGLQGLLLGGQSSGNTSSRYIYPLLAT